MRLRTSGKFVCGLALGVCLACSEGALDAQRSAPDECEGPVAFEQLGQALGISSTLDVRVSGSSNDAEESSAGSVSLTSTDLEFVNDGSRTNQVIGMRFSGLGIPPGSTVTAAYVEFRVDEATSEATSLTFRGQAADNAATFTTGASNVSGRATTAAQVAWTPAAWTTVNQLQRSPDITAIVQEIVARPNWQSGNALALIVRGSGKRVADAYDEGSGGAPLLHVEFSAPDPICGDLQCGGGETCATCPGDCGACPGPSVRFAVVGDFGQNNAREQAVATLVNGWSPEFVVTVGDNNYPDGAQSTIDNNIGRYYQQYIGNYTGSFGAGSAVNRFFPAAGNHDWVAPGLTPYLSYFTLPGNERYYSVDKGVVDLFIVDSDSHEPDGITSTSTQAQWLQSALAASNACWKLVFFHHAAYSSGMHGSTPSLRWPYESWGADAVLAGHDHTYERLQVGGIPHFVNGLGGAGSYNFGTIQAESVVRYNASGGAMRIDAQQGQITFAFINQSGTVVDSLTRTKTCQ